jgi:hypothetical protein
VQIINSIFYRPLVFHGALSAFSKNNSLLSPACLPIPPPGQDTAPPAFAGQRLINTDAKVSYFLLARVISTKKSHPFSGWLSCVGADNEIRTRDLNLGKVALYQLSYVRVVF